MINNLMPAGHKRKE